FRTRGVRLQRPKHRSYPARVSGPGSTSHHSSVAAGAAVDKFRSGRLDVRRERRIRGALPTLEDAGGGQRERRMTELGHRLLPLKEVANDLLQIGVVTDVFGGAPARDHEGDVVVRLHVLEGQVRVPTVPRLLC